MGAAAVEAIKAVGYAGAGTVEFIADATQGLRSDAFWFIEMNTRLQVEHPVTEAVTGLDLVEWQFRVAAGESLPLTQAQVRLEGHAVEARIYAEDPANDFLPSSGTIVALQLPPDVRVECGVEEGGEVTPYYDAMIAKLIVQAPTRAAALDRLTAALERTLVVGPRTNLALLVALCRTREFRQGRIDTEFIDRSLAVLGAVAQGPDRAAAAFGVARLLAAPSPDAAEFSEEDNFAANSPWAARDGFQLGGTRTLAIPIFIDGESANATVTYGKDGARVAIDGTPPATDVQTFAAADEVFVLRHGRQTRVRIKDFSAAAAAADGGDGIVKAPMHGRVLEVFVRLGDRVAAGQRLAVIEAMKMEHTLQCAICRRRVANSGSTGRSSCGRRAHHGDRAVRKAIM